MVERAPSVTPEMRWAQAFVAAQSEMPSIPKNKTVTTNKFSYSYADLPDIIDAVRPVLVKHGLGIGQTVESNGPGTVAVTTRIYHSEGHSETFGPLTLPAGNDAQSAGSAITYARRYSLCAALGIAADEDDDGALAKRSSGAARPSQPTPKTSREAAPEKSGEGVADSPPSDRSTTPASPVTPSPVKSGGGVVGGEVGGIPAATDLVAAYGRTKVLTTARNIAKANNLEQPKDPDEIDEDLAKLVGKQLARVDA